MKNLGFFVKNLSLLVFYVIKMRQYNSDIIGYINFFENLTNTNVKDCYLNKHLVFIVENGQMGKAIGKNGSNVKKLSIMFKKSIKIIEYSEDIVKFIQNLILPIKGKIYKENDEIVIELSSRTDKANLIGKNKRNLEELKNVVNKYRKTEIKIK